MKSMPPGVLICGDPAAIPDASLARIASADALNQIVNQWVAQRSLCIVNHLERLCHSVPVPYPNKWRFEPPNPLAGDAAQWPSTYRLRCAALIVALPSRRRQV